MVEYENKSLHKIHIKYGLTFRVMLNQNYKTMISKNNNVIYVTRMDIS